VIKQSPSYTQHYARGSGAQGILVKDGKHAEISLGTIEGQRSKNLINTTQETEMTV
jgi:hypothetical protein